MVHQFSGLMLEKKARAYITSWHIDCQISDQQIIWMFLSHAILWWSLHLEEQKGLLSIRGKQIKDWTWLDRDSDLPQLCHRNFYQVKPSAE